MSDAQTIYLKDYTRFGWIVDQVELDFHLSANATRVHSRIAFRPDPDAPAQPFFLHGKRLTLIRAAIDGAEVTPDVTEEGLTCVTPDAPFVWEAEVEIDPEGNTALEGLYMSNGMYCTQCEAEGFRKITYYPDRPDVMSVFTVRIHGDLPVLLSNGNPVSQSQGFAEWHDPWPKPAYLFALVAGELVAHSDHFTTRSGNPVDLNLWVRPGDLEKCAFGMEALKKSMSWDEEVYGREYDLDVFNIVAVDDFNMGAMENKGLNVFNSSAVLASTETATDMNFERIEAIIAHEYFHNWTGNRITCRDWFQLCLKEGLTVFRDSQFTADMRSEPVKRISDVIDLRARQFPEDGGPLAHPVRPDSFQEINNFYTATVYEKGAEVIRMLKTLVGDDAYAKALDLYFDRHDGQACTIEDWLKVFEDTTGRDLSQFKHWYTQAGTPHVKVEENYEPDQLTLTFTQHTPPSATTPNPEPQVIPIAIGLIGPDGEEVMPTQVFELTKDTQSFRFTSIEERPVPSILRGFSAPVILDQPLTQADQAHLLAYDTDPFNRWESAQTLARTNLMAMITDGAPADPAYLSGIKSVVTDDTLDPATRALIMGTPSQSELATALHQQGITPDPDAIYAAAETLAEARADAFADIAPGIYSANTVTEPYAPNAEQSGRRYLANCMLALITRRDGGAQARAQFGAADNMNQQFISLAQLISADQGADEVAAFASQWKDDRLVMDKWFAIQVSNAKPEAAVAAATALTEHPDFNHKNPNRFRAVLGALAMNHAGFHRADGAGYALLADWLITLDPVNPQTTARMCSAFQTWRRYDAGRQALIEAQLERIAGTEGLSRDTGEMIGRILQA